MGQFFMEYMEWLTIIAIMVGPFLGIWAYGQIEDRKRAEGRKLDIFKTLMATRATALSTFHVEALNRIDVEFTKNSEKKVRDAWKVLLDHYWEAPEPPTRPLPDARQTEQDKYTADYQQYENSQHRWGERVRDLRAALLKEMGTLFGYDFNEVGIKKAVYYPRLHGDIEIEQQLLLVMANDVLAGKRPLGMYVVNWPEQTDKQE